METNKFAQAMEREVAWKTTENGQPALNTTFDKCLDLFKDEKESIEIKNRS